MVKLKRAAGAGRKPIGEFKDLTSVFSLRMPADLQKQVEIAAQRTGRSRSQEILGASKTHLTPSEKKQTLALCGLSFS